MTSKRQKVLPAGREAVFVNTKILHLSLNDNRFVVGKRTKLWYILSGTEPYRNIVALAVHDKRTSNSGNHLPLPLNSLEPYSLMIYTGQREG